MISNHVQYFSLLLLESSNFFKLERYLQHFKKHWPLIIYWYFFYKISFQFLKLFYQFINIIGRFLHALKTFYLFFLRSYLKSSREDPMPKAGGCSGWRITSQWWKNAWSFMLLSTEFYRRGQGETIFTAYLKEICILSSSRLVLQKSYSLLRKLVLSWKQS